MEITKMDGSLFKRMIISGACALDKNKDIIDSLNVFPVPDGDTGTNMSLTFLAAAREAEKLSTNNTYEVAKAVSDGSLRGARGNSGVILSQLFRGFAKGLEGCESVTADDLANAFVKASETAYKAVMKPKEGTILTIARAMAEKATDLSFDTEDIEFLLKETVKYGNEMLAKTTEMLPALKQAGVVDAGGYGLIQIWEAALSCISDDSQGVSLFDDTIKPGVSKAAIKSVPFEDIRFSYCTEFFICVDNPGEDVLHNLKQFISEIGDSIVAVADEHIIKIHVHTNNPGAVLEKALEIGYLDNIKIENMRLQHSNIIEFEIKEEDVVKETFDANDNAVNIEDEIRDVAFIVVSAGDGFRELFESLGADAIIEGGQTMNPSTNDFIAAIENLNAKNIIIMPNNKNIILAAQQASFLVEGKNVIVLPTKCIPQGVCALVNYTDVEPLEENCKRMEEAIKNVRTGQVTYAVRATVLDDKQIDQGDVICLLADKIVLVEKDIERAAKGLLDIMLEDGGEVLSIFYGEAVNQDEAQVVLDYALGKGLDIEAEIHRGGQPIYHYIFSVE